MDHIENSRIQVNFELARSFSMDLWETIFVRNRRATVDR